VAKNHVIFTDYCPMIPVFKIWNGYLQGVQLIHDTKMKESITELQFCTKLQLHLNRDSVTTNN